MGLLFQCCVPSFAPEVNAIKKINYENTIVQWNKLIGILDQNFPDYVIIEKGDQQIDTICSSHNIADVKILNSHEILLGFYGRPKKYNKIINIPKEIMEYKIIIDTTYIRK
jgi:hypothetical protein